MMFEEDLPGIRYFLTCVIFIILTCVCSNYWLNRRKLREFADSVPGPRGLPIVGNLFDKDIWQKLNKEFGNEKILKIWRGTELIVFLRNPADIEKILSSKEVIDHSSGYDSYKPWLFGGILTVNGDRWRHQRRAIAPMFRMDYVKTFIPIFNDNSRKLVHELDKEIGKKFDCYNYLTSTSFDILLECVTDIKKSDDQEAVKYEKSAIALREIFSMKLKNFWLRFDRLFLFTKHYKQEKEHLKNVHQFSGKVSTIHEEKFIKNGRVLPGLHRKLDEQEESTTSSNNNNEGENKRFSFAEYLLDAAQGGVVLVPYEIQNNIDTFLCKGHETTASVCSFFLCIMAERQDIQDLVYEELLRELGEGDAPLTYDDTLKLKYLELCLMETMRLYPPIPMFARELHKDVPLASRKDELPAECTVVIDAYKMHRDPELYPNPDRFDPERFLSARCAKRHYYAFIPFSAGARCCVGRKFAMLTMKVILATFLRRFTVLPGIKADDWKVESDVSLKKSDGFLIQIEKRI